MIFIAYCYPILSFFEPCPIKIGDTTQELVINLTAKLKQIVRHFGKKAIEIYNLNEGGSGDIAKC